MEKLCIISTVPPVEEYDLNEVHELLKQGWTIKSIDQKNSRDYVTVYVVLSKD